MNKMYESVEMYFLLFLQFTVLSDVLFSCKKLNVDLAYKLAHGGNASKLNHAIIYVLQKKMAPKIKNTSHCIFLHP